MPSFRMVTMSTQPRRGRPASSRRKKSPASPELSIIVPVHNEADNIRPLIEDISSAMGASIDYEIVYVDDGSTDATPQRLREAVAETPRLRVIEHRGCFGQSAAILSGVEAARAHLIATLDGDGQNDPADIPNLMRIHAESGSPTGLMLAGLRAKRRDTAIKRLSSRIANGVRSRLLGDRTPDTGCGLKLFSRASFLDLPRFDHMHRFLPALMLGAGGEVRSVPVNHRPRGAGATKYGTFDRLWVGISDLFGVLWLRRRRLYPIVEREYGQGES